MITRNRSEYARMGLFLIIGGLLLLLPTSGCVGVASGVSAESPVSERNRHTQVALKVGNVWHVDQPPRLVFTGQVITGAGLSKWARANGLKAVAIHADQAYAQVTSASAIECILWLKRFNRDTNYAYVGDTRDCDNFARRARAFPDLFSDAPSGAQAAVFGIYAHMETPFAGVSDGYHALNVAWTDQGVPVFEPQGIDLVYQDLRYWANKTGITHHITD